MGSQQQQTTSGAVEQPATAETTEIPNCNNIWSEKRGEADATYDNIIAPTQKDFDNLGESLLTLVDRLLAAVATGNFPSLEQSKQMCENNMYDCIYSLEDNFGVALPDDVEIRERREVFGDESDDNTGGNDNTGGDYNTGTGGDDNTGTGSDDNISGKDSTSGIDNTGGDDNTVCDDNTGGTGGDYNDTGGKYGTGGTGGGGGGMTHVDRNEAVSDAAMPQNLSNKETVVDLMKLAHEGRTKVLAAPPAAGLENVRLVMEDVMPVLACDGQPAEQILKIMMKMSLTDLVVIVLSGGFHLLLCAFKVFGVLFAFCTMRAVFGCWRRSEGQLKWVLDNPGDPNQIAEESMMMLLGFFAAAIFGLIATRQTATPNEAHQLSAVNVLDHIHSHAKAFPEVFMHANMLPLMGMILMLQDAEAKADSDLPMSAMRLLWPVFCATHRTGHVFIVARFFVWWHCATWRAKKILQT